MRPAVTWSTRIAKQRALAVPACLHTTSSWVVVGADALASIVEGVAAIATARLIVANVMVRMDGTDNLQGERLDRSRLDGASDRCQRRKVSLWTPGHCVANGCDEVNLPGLNERSLPMYLSALRQAAMRRRWFLALAGFAFLIRLVPVLTGGGLAFYGRYDDSVYYTAADALTFGRLPYKDFTLLHPPLLMLVLTPFALIGRMTTDATGLALARLVFMGIGATNTVLVAVIARRWGRYAAVVAGLMYAGWLPAVYGEQSTMLEPLGTTALCVALLLLLRRDGMPSRLARKQ